MFICPVLLRVNLLPCELHRFLKQGRNSQGYSPFCFKCIFTLGTKNLGVHTKQGSGLIVMVGYTATLQKAGILKFEFE